MTLTTLDNGVTLPLCQEHLELAAGHIRGTMISATLPGACEVCDFTRRLLRLPEPTALRGLPTDNLWKISCMGSHRLVRVLRGSTVLLNIQVGYGMTEWVASPDMRIYGDVEFDIPEGVQVVVWREENDFNVMIELRQGVPPKRIPLNPVVRVQKVIR